MILLLFYSGVVVGPCWFCYCFIQVWWWDPDDSVIVLYRCGGGTLMILLLSYTGVVVGPAAGHAKTRLLDSVLLLKASHVHSRSSIK